MLDWILLNIWILLEDILHTMAALSESKAVKKMLELLPIEPFFIGIKKLKGFSRLAHIVSTRDS